MKTQSSRKTLRGKPGTQSKIKASQINPASMRLPALTARNTLRTVCEIGKRNIEGPVELNKTDAAMRIRKASQNIKYPVEINSFSSLPVPKRIKKLRYMEVKEFIS